MKDLPQLLHHGLFLVLLLASVTAVGQRLPITPVHSSYILGPYIHYLEDASGGMTINDMLTERNLAWKNNNENELNLGYSSSQFWLHIAIDSEFEQNWLMSISYPLLDDIQVFLVKDSEVINAYRTGDYLPFSQRPISHPDFLFPMELSHSDNIDIYVSVRSTSALILNLQLWKKPAFIGYNTRKSLLDMMLFGALLLLSFYAFLIGLSFKNASYIFFSGFSFFLFLASFHQQGYAFSYIWPNNVWWQNHGLHLCLASSAVFFSFFIIEYLRLRKQHVWWYRYFLFLAVVSAILGILSLWVQAELFIPAFFANGLFIGVGVFAVSSQLSLHGHHLAKYLLYSNIVMVLAFGFWLISALGVSAEGARDLRIIQVALLAMFLVLSYAVALGLRREKEQAQTMKDCFMSTITHELLTPINGIQLSLSLVKEHVTETGRQYWDMAQNSNKDLLGLVESMIIFTEAKTGKLSIECQRFNLIALLENTYKLFYLEGQSRLKFELDIAADMPTWIIADKRKINFIIKQLLKNAFAFTKKGHVSIAASIKLGHGHSAALKLIVKDNGFGIDNELQDIIFDAFNQADSSITREHGGLGIGLTNVKDILQLLGGTLELNSQLGLGSEFILTIPIEISDALDSHTSDPHMIESEDALSDEGKRKRAEAYAEHAKAGKILVVEDNPVNMKLMLKLLEVCGYKALAAEHGAHALSVLRQDPGVVAILMDCQMPVMDGFEATKEIRKMQNKSNLPIIAVTANVSAEDKQRCYDVGMNDYLRKPASREGIQATLDKWLDIA